MEVIQTQTFAKAVKKLHRNQKEDLDKAVKTIVKDTNIGELKVGDLAGVRVHKFKMVNQSVLLAYTYNPDSIVLTLLVLGSHENFYRDLKGGGMVITTGNKRSLKAPLTVKTHLKSE